MSIVQSVSFLFGYAVVGIVLAWLGAGVWALVAAMIGQTLCEVILYTLMQPYPKRPQLSIQALRDVANHSAGFSVARLTQYFAAQGDNLIVGRWLGVDALGLYSRAFRFAALPANLLGDSAGTVLFAAMTKVQTEEMRMRNAFRQGTALTALVIMPLTAIAVILAPEFFVVVLGPQWSGAVLPFQILALGMFFRAAWKVGGSVVRAVGAVHQMSVASMVYAALIVVGALVGQLYGLVGVSVGVTTAVVLYYFLQLFQVKRLIHIGWPEILSLHVPAFVTTILVLVVAWVAAGLARQFGLPEWLVIVATSAGVGAALLVSVWLMPKLVLGEENIAWLRVFARHLFGKKSPV
jgi:PST family polysaccharide transporter